MTNRITNSSARYGSTAKDMRSSVNRAIGATMNSTSPGGGDDNQRRGADPGSRLERIDELRDRERSVEEHAGDDGIEDGDSPGFRRGEDSRHHSAEEQYRDHQHRQRDPGAASERAKPFEAADCSESAQARSDVGGDHQVDSDDDSGEHAADQQPADRDAELRADDHERYRRRDDRADDRRRGDERAGELARVLLLDH